MDRLEPSFAARSGAALVSCRSPDVRRMAAAKIAAPHFGMRRTHRCRNCEVRYNRTLYPAIEQCRLVAKTAAIAGCVADVLVHCNVRWRDRALADVLWRSGLRVRKSGAVCDVRGKI